MQAIAHESEDDRRTAIRVTAAFLEDLHALPVRFQPLILAFDGYDSSASLIDRWFESTLVQSLCAIDHVRLIVCGREVSPTSVKRRTPAGRFLEIPLKGVMETQDWAPIIAALEPAHPWRR